MHLGAASNYPTAQHAVFHLQCCVLCAACCGACVPVCVRACRKEELWPHVREFADRALEHVSCTLARLQEAGEPAALWAVHGHYADAGG